MPDFTTETRDDITILKVVGSIRTGENSAFSEELERLADAGCFKLVIDAAELDYVNSQAIGDLIAFYQKVLGQGGDVALAGLQPVVLKVMRAVGLEGIMGVFDTVEEAESSLKA